MRILGGAILFPTLSVFFVRSICHGTITSYEQNDDEKTGRSAQDKYKQIHAYKPNDKETKPTKPKTPRPTNLTKTINPRDKANK